MIWFNLVGVPFRPPATAVVAGNGYWHDAFFHADYSLNAYWL